jgi:hypothetical protein
MDGRLVRRFDSWVHCPMPFLSYDIRGEQKYHLILRGYRRIKHRNKLNEDRKILWEMIPLLTLSWQLSETTLDLRVISFWNYRSVEINIVTKEKPGGGMRGRWNHPEVSTHYPGIAHSSITRYSEPN